MHIIYIYITIQGIYTVHNVYIYNCIYCTYVIRKFPTLFWNWLYSCEVVLLTACSKLNQTIQKFKPGHLGGLVG